MRMNALRGTREKTRLEPPVWKYKLPLEFYDRFPWLSSTYTDPFLLSTIPTTPHTSHCNNCLILHHVSIILYYCIIYCIYFIVSLYVLLNLIIAHV